MVLKTERRVLEFSLLTRVPGIFQEVVITIFSVKSLMIYNLLQLMCFSMTYYNSQFAQDRIRGFDNHHHDYLFG